MTYSFFEILISKILRTAFLQNSDGCFYIFKKVIKQLFHKGVNVKRCLKKCPCYDVLITFCSWGDMLFDVEKVELVCLQTCCQFPG